MTINRLEEASQTLSDFVRERGAGEISLRDIEVEFLPKPHRPPRRLPLGKRAIYGFCTQDSWLKIGIAGPNSAARYTSQHYNPNSARSTLARSLIRFSRTLNLHDFDPSEPGRWIMTNTDRINILLPAATPRPLQQRLEQYFHQRLLPRFEGRC